MPPYRSAAEQGDRTVDYENRQPAEGINVTAGHPLRRFAVLVGAAALLVVVLVVITRFAGGAAARLVPFSVEQRVMRSLDIPFGDAPLDDPVRVYLDELAQRLVPSLGLPADMSVIVHYDSADTFNAFATLGGNLLFYRGLLERMPDENALAMVMAHEIAHVLHRDPAAGLGGGVASALVLAAVTGSVGTGAATDGLSRTGLLTSVQFTRRMERQADRVASAALAERYGHLHGAATLFEVIQAQRLPSRRPVWLERFTATHPLDADRIRAIEAHAQELGVPLDGPATPLPAEVVAALRAAAPAAEPD